MELNIFITKFNELGVCEVSIEEVTKAWNKDWCIAQWNDDYTLARWKDDHYDIKLQISKEQAKELIIDLDLNVFSSLFKSGKTWK